MAVFLRLGTEVDFEFRGRDAAALGFFNLEFCAGGEGFQSVDHGGGRGSGIDQGADGHVTADSGEGVQVAKHSLL